MITNSGLTIYHYAGLDVATHFEKWVRYNYDNANDVQIRIPYEKNENLNIENFKIGDIIVKGIIDVDIERQQDLDNNYEIYNITSIRNNDFGNNKHIYIGGK